MENIGMNKKLMAVVRALEKYYIQYDPEDRLVQIHHVYHITGNYYGWSETVTFLQADAGESQDDYPKFRYNDSQWAEFLTDENGVVYRNLEFRPDHEIYLMASRETCEHFKHEPCRTGGSGQKMVAETNGGGMIYTIENGTVYYLGDGVLGVHAEDLKTMEENLESTWDLDNFHSMTADEWNAMEIEETYTLEEWVSKLA